MVGVAGNVKNGGLAEGDEPEYYRLRRNRAEDWDSHASVIVQTSLSAPAMSAWIRTEVAGLDPSLPVVVEMMDQRVDQLADRPRFESALLGMFALVGVLLAATGIYGVISFMVVQRTQEIGLRMALGATRRDVLRLVARSGGRLIVIGAIVGLVASLLVSRGMTGLLYEIGPADPLTLFGVMLLMVTVALVATWIPARAASKLDPLVALHYE